ncbi:MAG: hypothetical protein R3A52_27045 [Polyangiales bacterium]
MCLLVGCGDAAPSGSNTPTPQSTNVCGYEARTSCRGSEGDWTFQCAAVPGGSLRCRDVNLGTSRSNGCTTEHRNAVDAPDCSTAYDRIFAPADPCAPQPDCASCTAQPSCGWCDGRCYQGTASGPSETTCASGTTWAWLSSQCR